MFRPESFRPVSFSPASWRFPEDVDDEPKFVIPLAPLRRRARKRRRREEELLLFRR